MSDCEISIVTPSYNQGAFIRKTIESVLSHKNVEYIIIDGGSKDGTCEIIEQYANDLHFWVSERDSGQSQAINKGIKRSSGEIINWLNSDDYYEPEALKIVANHFDKINVTCVAGKSELFNSKGPIKQSIGTDVYSNNLAKTIGWARIDQPETFFSREAWDKVGNLNENLHYCMDREWWMRYLYHFGLDGIVSIPDVLVNFRIHQDSKTSGFQERFEMEHNTLFYLMAKAANNTRIQKLIEDHNTIDLTLRSDIEKWTNLDLLEKALNYHLLKRADELYYQDNNEAAKAYLVNVNSELLAKEDLKLLRSLKLKTKLPLSIIHFFRKK